MKGVCNKFYFLKVDCKFFISDFFFLFLKVDGKYRQKWDDYVLQLDVVDSDKQTSTDLVHWVTKCPYPCLLYTSPSPRDATLSRMPSSA